MRPALSIPLVIAALASVAVQALVLLAPLRPVFHAESLDVHHVLLVLECSVAVVVVVEVAKLVERAPSFRITRGGGARKAVNHAL